jgi:dolichol-phosphate mannosyltransferase
MSENLESATQFATQSADRSSNHRCDRIELSVIAPTYNEAQNLEALVAEVGSALRGIEYEMIVCDDDSPDRTWALAEEIGKTNPRVRALRRMRDRGLARAVVDGFSVARGEAVACIDADLQHDPAILPQMLEALRQGAQLVVASRYVAGGGTANWNWRRRFTSWVAAKMADWTLGVPLHDPMSGYFLLRREDFLPIREKLNPDGFKILLEIAAHLKPERLCEVPYRFRLRRAGSSKLSPRVVLEYLVQLGRLYVAGHTFRRAEGGPTPKAVAEASRRRTAA